MSVQGLYDISDDTFMSVPCIVGENGVTHVLIQTLDDTEKTKVVASAKTLLGVQKSVVL